VSQLTADFVGIKLHRMWDTWTIETDVCGISQSQLYASDVNKTTRFKTKAKTKTEKFGLKTKT